MAAPVMCMPVFTGGGLRHVTSAGHSNNFGIRVTDARRLRNSQDSVRGVSPLICDRRQVIICDHESRVESSGATPSHREGVNASERGQFLQKSSPCTRSSDSNAPQFDLDSQPASLKSTTNRRKLFGLSVAALGAAFALESGLAQSAAAAEEMKRGRWPLADLAANPAVAAIEKAKEFRVYEASVLGEPVPVGDKSRVWTKLLGARVIYLGEAERVPDPTDKVLELGIVQKLRDECFKQARPLTLAFSLFPRPMQPQLDLYQDGRLTDGGLRTHLTHWPPGRWEEYLPLLRYCRDFGVRIYAAGVPDNILRAVQADGVQALSPSDRKKYAPPLGGSPLLSGARPPLGAGVDASVAADAVAAVSQAVEQGPYQFAQARIVADHTMAQAVGQAMADGAALGVLVLITGASHVRYGARGRGVPARVAGKLKKSYQVTVLLNPERQTFRMEGDLPEADLLWYSGARACKRNCFDRAEVARVMGAAGRRREALPSDIQAGLERGLVSPDTLKSFFELESQPLIAEATRRFQGLRERWLADPRFLQRLCIEEAISISTTLLAQYQKRGERFWSELEYVITDSSRGAVVDFFTVWLPAPTLSFRNTDAAGGGSGVVTGIRGLLGSLPDNAFQRAVYGEEWGFGARVAAVVVGGLKLAVVGFVSSIGTIGVSNTMVGMRQRLSKQAVVGEGGGVTRPPIVKTALVYGGFLGTSANLRYQAIAGLVEHWGADYLLAGNPLAGAVLSFVARTANSYWGTGQWVDLARKMGLQGHHERPEEDKVGKGEEGSGGIGGETGVCLPEMMVSAAAEPVDLDGGGALGGDSECAGPTVEIHVSGHGVAMGLEGKTEKEAVPPARLGGGQ